MGQDDAVKGWAKHGVKLEYFSLGWGYKEPFKPKLERMLKKIDELYALESKQIILVGASAGASAIINAYAQCKEKVAKLVYICGKIQNPQTIGVSYYQENPAFEGSMKTLRVNLDRLSSSDKAKFLSVIPIYDNLVPVADTKIEGVKELKMPIAGHSLSIAYAITLGKRKIIKSIS